MHVIVGLGNPGSKYEGTRHNVGFYAAEEIARANGIAINMKKHKAMVGTGYIEGEKVLIARPQTFMNLSGESVREIMDFYKLSPEDFIVIYDDINLEVGALRIREKGSAGGHNGLKSIIAHLGTQDFPRIRIGVGEKPEGWDLADYVLGHFDSADREAIEAAGKAAAAAAALMVRGETKQAMNLYNKKKGSK